VSTDGRDTELLVLTIQPRTHSTGNSSAMIARCLVTGETRCTRKCFLAKTVFLSLIHATVVLIGLHVYRFTDYVTPHYLMLSSSLWGPRSFKCRYYGNWKHRIDVFKIKTTVRWQFNYRKPLDVGNLSHNCGITYGCLYAITCFSACGSWRLITLQSRTACVAQFLAPSASGNTKVPIWSGVLSEDSASEWSYPPPQLVPV
jgi:hypothetical protein